jgi:Tol biopolymer transport system component/DNA-binding winged helix-turn-helix (wHTH) protein
MPSPQKYLYEFGEFSFDPTERTLKQNGDQTLLSPKVSETLLALIEEAGHTIGHEDLIKRVWADTFASKNNLDQNIFQLRKLLGDSFSEPRYIKTVPRLGYQFLSSVREVPTQQTAKPAEELTQDFESDETAPLAPVQPALEIEGGVRSNAKTKLLVFALLLLAAVAATFFVLYKPSNSDGNFPVRVTTERARASTLATNGDVGSAALSPSGEQIAYTIKRGEVSEIWTAASDESVKRLVTTDALNLSNLVFSGDAGHIYYTRNDDKEFSLYVVSAGGGVPTKILANVGSRISFSPDGKQFAFIRYYVTEGESVLFVANSNGTQERRIATRKDQTAFVPVNGPAWSPDGKTIVVMEEGTSTNFSSLTAFDVVNGTEKRINTLSEWPRFRDVAWLPDGSGLMLIVTEGGPTATTQIWRFSYPGFEAKQIANGPEVYESLSLAKSSNRMLVVGRHSVSDIWVTADSDKDEPRRTTETSLAGRAGVCWLPDGRIVYQSRESGVDELWMMDTNGGRKLLTQGSTGNFYPSVTADGRHLIFMSSRTGVLHVWRMDLDSGALTQLTNGSEEQWPHVSADGKWVYYNSWDSGSASVWKVSLDGGQPLLVINESSYHPKPSPDGNLLAYANSVDSPRDSQRKVVSVKGGPAKYSFDGPLKRLGPVYWSRDGRALLYADQRGGVSNIYRQALEGGEPKQLTYFTEGQIYFFDQSWDGKRLAVARGNVSRNIQLFSSY